jgi:ribosomal protein L37E
MKKEKCPRCGKIANWIYKAYKGMFNVIQKQCPHCNFTLIGMISKWLPFEKLKKR